MNHPQAFIIPGRPSGLPHLRNATCFDIAPDVHTARLIPRDAGHYKTQICYLRMFGSTYNSRQGGLHAGVGRLVQYFPRSPSPEIETSRKIVRT